MLAKDIKNGTIVVYNEAPCLIEGIQVQSPSARGGATLYKFRARNVVTKNKVDITLKGTESLDDADFKKREVSVMYQDVEALHLMDTETYEQYALPLDDCANELQYMKEGQDGLLALIYNDECVGINIPATVELTIAQCDPGVKGNSATGRTKPLSLETGLQIQGPEYLKQGEVVKVDTRTGEFLGRA
ncbi:Elongation factor P-like protein [Posidoniimonas polymericola]|uniref:Elongation factor P-like protein n=1 Tax=Posidoniimonas polymericola TaxID=2528002 RepID=A0A5C5YS93_9BACT|nr:translation elongation factor EF-P [Posidoniimonas polymericola]TWT77809.1 Elongation factor P-like protein [Posidoniimonas polymericola]